MTIKQTTDHMVATISSSGAFFHSSDTTDQAVVEINNNQIARHATDLVDKKWKAIQADEKSKGSTKKLVERLVLAEIPASNFIASQNQEAYDAGKEWLYGALPENVQALFEIDSKERTKEQAQIVRRAMNGMASVMSSIARSLERAYARQAKKKAQAEGKKPVATASEKTKILSTLTNTKKKFESNVFDFNIVEATKKLDELIKIVSASLAKSKKAK